MENKVNYKPGNKVRITKSITLVLAIICILASIPQIIEGMDLGFTTLGVAIGFLLLSGVLQGFAAVVDAACEYSWEFERKYSKSPEPKMDDADVQ